MGLSIPFIYTQLIKEHVGSRTGRVMLMGKKMEVEDCVRLNIVQDTYIGQDQLNKKIAEFVRDRAPIGKHRATYSASKTFMVNELVDKMTFSEIYNIGSIFEIKREQKQIDTLMKKFGVAKL